MVYRCLGWMKPQALNGVDRVYRAIFYFLLGFHLASATVGILAHVIRPCSQQSRPPAALRAPDLRLLQ